MSVSDRPPTTEPIARSVRVGFVGLGSLGLVLAGNLIARGHRVVGYRRGSLEPLSGIGGTPAASPAAAAGSDVLMTCLPTPEALTEVVAGPNGFLSRGGLLPVLVEMSTLDIDVKMHTARQYAAHGGVMLDCPISGIPTAVAARKGLMLASGELAVVERWRSVLEDMLDSVVYCGDFGNGLRVKYVANFLVGVHIQATAEAVALAEILGLDSLFVAKTLRGSAASSAQFDVRGPIMAAREPTKPLGTPRILLKDLEIIDRVARAGGLSPNLLSAAIPRYREAMERGYGDEDVARMIDLVAPKRQGD